MPSVEVSSVKPPPAELSENASWLRLTMDLPGVQVKDMEVEVRQSVLSVKGCRRTMSLDGSVCLKKYKFQRRFAIDTQVVNVGASQARLVDGVFTFKVPKVNLPREESMQINATANITENVTDNASSDASTSSAEQDTTGSVCGHSARTVRHPLPREFLQQRTAPSTVSAVTDEDRSRD